MTSVHASAVLVGDRAVLIRGPSGSGKSRLAFELILAGRAGQIPSSTLIGDDRVRLEGRQNGLIVAPVAELMGLIEVRGLGIRRIAYAVEAIVALVVDLDAKDAERLPAPGARRVAIDGILLDRIAVETGQAAFPLVAAQLLTAPSYETITNDKDC